MAEIVRKGLKAVSHIYFHDLPFLTHTNACGNIFEITASPLTIEIRKFTRCLALDLHICSQTNEIDH